MKKFIKGVFLTMILFTGGAIASSCDPCSGVVCTNGNCSNGICVCDPGYKKSDNKCVSISSDYTGENWHGTQIGYYTFMRSDTQSVVYTIEMSEVTPNQIILKNFLGHIGNDIPLTIDLEKKNIFVEETVLPVGITNGSITNPSFLPVPYDVAGTIKANKINLTLNGSGIIEDYKLVLQR
ncbi:MULTISPECIES: EB domain-containing protein [unclassified Aureispira]|uniref:EB domain-containing protein n=1 Tax=unclassified Aureispira TaxID=2649989 RepID=UPI000695C7E4|nr:MULTISPECIES: EB domain-containing protein [unclassified Aureispira]WMX12030.1 EB domain-containing protein [Aureispira sp. CCB-E]